MDTFLRIDVKQASELLESQQAVLVDIRDLQSFQSGRPAGAFHLTNDSLVDFMREHEFDQPVLVLCYHGVSSQGAAQYLVNQGFEQVYSVDGGFTEWQKLALPVVTG